MPRSVAGQLDAKAIAAEGGQLTRELQLITTLLRKNDVSVEQLYEAFQQADPRRRGVITNASVLVEVLCEFLPLKYCKRIDFDLLASEFATTRGRINYRTLCKELQKLAVDLAAVKANSQKIPPVPRSPLKHQQPMRRRSQQQEESEATEQSEADVTQRPIRVDKRLELQRVLIESVRKKLLRGLITDNNSSRVGSTQLQGFAGVQAMLLQLDKSDNGYLNERIFVEAILSRLKTPLTKQEKQFLLTHVRAPCTSSNQQQKQEPQIDYEQIESLFHLDSDASLSDTDDENEFGSDGDEQLQRRSSIPSSPTKSSQLGADFLAAEKKLQHFLQMPINSSADGTERHETPRSSITGAERFLEQAEARDQHKTGFLHEDDFHHILRSLDIEIMPLLLRSILSRFPRSADKMIKYTAFLQRYGQDPQHSRDRRKFKRFLTTLFPLVRVPVAEWIDFLRKRFERYDMRVHQRKQGVLPEREFIRALQGKSIVCKLSVDQAAEALALFFRLSTGSTSNSIQYNEFLRLIREYHTRQYRNANNDGHGASPSSAKTTISTAAAVGTTTAEESVGDYLMWHATARERQNFEQLMDTLHQFQLSLSSQDEANSVSAIENGVAMVLGPRLKVQIQFSL